MAQNVNPTFVKTPNRGLMQVSTANSTATVTVYAGGASGSKIVSIIAGQVSVAAIDFQIALVRSGTSYVIGTASVPSNAGGGASTPTVNLLANIPLAVDPDSNPFLMLASSADSLTVTLQSALSAGALATVVAIGGDF